MRNNRIAAAAAAIVAAAALVACNGNDEDPEGMVHGSEQKVIEMPDQPGSVEDYEGALEDADLETCESQDGALQVPGTVTNPESEELDYRIYVSAMDGNGTQGIVQVDVTGVAGGDPAEWSTKINLSNEDLDCVLRVERFVVG